MLKGRVIEFEYAKGFGRVQLEDGRVLPFDVSACRQGTPDEGAPVSVELVLSRLGGEKVGLLRVKESWEALPGEFAFLVTPRGILLVRDGVARPAPPGTAAAVVAGDTGYATIEAKQGAVGHSTAWSASAYGRTGQRDERLQALRKSPLRSEERALFRPLLENQLAGLFDDVHDPDQRESRFFEDYRRELQTTIELANQFGVDTRAFLPPKK